MTNRINNVVVPIKEIKPLIVKEIKFITRRDLLVKEWVESGFSPELVAICSNTPFIRNLESVVVSTQETFGKELDETG